MRGYGMSVVSSLTDICFHSNNSNNVEPTFHLHTTIILNLVSVIFQRQVHWAVWRMLPRIKSLSAKLPVGRNHLGFMSRKRCNLKRHLLFMVRMDVYLVMVLYANMLYCRGATPFASRSLHPKDPTMHSCFRFQWRIIRTSRKGNQATNSTRNPRVCQYESGCLDRSCLSWNCQYGMYMHAFYTWGKQLIIIIIIIVVLDQSLPYDPTSSQPCGRCIWSRRRWTSTRISLASFADRVRIFLAIFGVSWIQHCLCKKAYRPKVHSAGKLDCVRVRVHMLNGGPSRLMTWPYVALGAFRQRGSSRTWFLKDDIASDIWQVPQPSCVHSSIHQQYLFPIHLRDRASQWRSRVAWDSWKHYQWFRIAFERRTQDFLNTRLDPVAQGQITRLVSSSTGILRCAVPWKGPSPYIRGTMTHT